MNIVSSSYTLRAVFNGIGTYLVSKSSEWTGRVMSALKLGSDYLEDPRVASLAIFNVNFIILELAVRISRLVSSCFPRETQTEKSIKSAIEIILVTGLTLAGNIAFIKATGIALHPCLVAAFIGTTFIVKYNLQNYVEHKPILTDRI